MSSAISPLHTTGQGILLKGSDSLILQVFFDSNWGACLDTRRYISRYLLLFRKSHVTWKSKKQHIVSKSYSEVEYQAMYAAASEVT